MWPTALRAEENGCFEGVLRTAAPKANTTSCAVTMSATEAVGARLQLKAVLHALADRALDPVVEGFNCLTGHQRYRADPQLSATALDVRQVLSLEGVRRVGAGSHWVEHVPEECLRK